MKISLSVSQRFYSKDINVDGIWVDEAYAKTCNTLLSKIKTKFDFSINVLGTQVYPTQYLLKPPLTILFSKKPTTATVSHELGHHVYHKLLNKKEKQQLDKLCKDNSIDPNEQFATSVEFLVTGKAERFKRKDPKVKESLASKLKPLVGKYFEL